MNRPRRWWQDAVIYQIYPRSFQDSNDDGIGDLPGITRRLDYLQDLGIDAIWLSPIFASPMHDFGYDISDYRAIDPVFGTVADFRTLLREADRRRIRIILDGVFNHTSDQHPWFRESRSSRDNPKRDWYIWRKKRNNWRSMFGGSAWQKDPTTGEYYLHSFLKQQPDLNWRNPAVKRAVFDEMRYWLDMGVAGFRLDVANFYFKDARFRNNPFGIGPTPRPYDLQRHLYDRDRPELHDLFRELRQLFDGYDAMTVGEIFAERPSGPLSASYLGAGDELHLAFDFSLMYAKWGAQTFQRLLAHYHDACHPASWPCTVLSNHDQPRAVSRFGHDHREEIARLLMVLLLTMRGTPFLYYGEELGMQNLRLRRRQIVDPVGKRYWPFHPGRDGARTPMQWDTSPHAGFSTATPWLPVHSDYPTVNVQELQQQSGSLLHLVRELTALRRNRADLREGSLSLHPSRGNVLCYERGQTRIALNFASTPATIASRPGDALLLSTHRIAGKQMQDQIRLSGFEAVILGAV